MNGSLFGRHTPQNVTYNHTHTHTGALAGGEVENKLERQNWGNLIIAIDPEIIGPVEDFKEKVQVS